jgi:hypothetical protein
LYRDVQYEQAGGIVTEDRTDTNADASQSRLGGAGECDPAFLFVGAPGMNTVGGFFAWRPASSVLELDPVLDVEPCFSTERCASVHQTTEIIAGTTMTLLSFEAGGFDDSVFEPMCPEIGNAEPGTPAIFAGSTRLYSIPHRPSWRSAMVRMLSLNPRLPPTQFRLFLNPSDSRTDLPQRAW